MKCFAVPFPSVRQVALLLCVAFALTIAIPLLHSQNRVSTASLSGVVTDPQGKRVTGATVTLLNPNLGTIRKFTTDSVGIFSFSLLPPGTYNLKIDAPGFGTYELNGIVLEVGQDVDLNPALLAVGQVSQRLVVSGEAPLLTTDNANIGSEVSGKQILEMPLNFRSSLALVFLDSSNRWFDQGALGGSVDTADQDYSLMGVGGQFFGQNSFTLDGTWNGMMAYNGVIYVPSIDTVQEFKMQTYSFSAQYPMTEGNVVNVVTKSGTSQFHGDVYEFLRNYALDANYFFNKLAGTARPATRMNQFGITAGGPLYIPKIYPQRKRTFFFAGYEGLRLGAVSSIFTAMPTTAMKGGDLSAFLGSTSVGTDAMGNPIYPGQIYNPFSTRQIGTTGSGAPIYYRDPVPNNNIASVPGLMDAVAKNMVAFYPSPTSTSLTNNFFADQSVPTTSDEMNVRIDQNLSDNARFYARYSRKWEAKVESGDLYGSSDPAGPGQTNPNNRYSVASGYSQVLSPTLTLSINFGYNRWVEGNVGQGLGFQSSSLGLPAGLNSASPFFPTVNITGFGSLGAATNESTAEDEGSLSADVVKVRGGNTFSLGYMGILSEVLGGGLVHTTFNYTSAFSDGPNPQSPTAGTGNAFGSFLMGATASGDTGVVELPALTKTLNGWYLQDDWKTTKNLTLNLGMRYDIQLAPTERHNRQAYFEPGQVNPISEFSMGGPYYGQLVYNTPGNRYFYQNSYTNFSPRVGFSYLTAHRFVTRGGFALFFPDEWAGDPSEPGYAQVTTLVSSLNGGLNPSSTLSNPFPQGILPVVGNTEGGLTDVGQTLSTSVFKRPSDYIEQWMLGFQYSPSNHDVIEASYIGNRALKFVISGLNLNQLPPQDLALGSGALTAATANPFYGLAPVTGSACGLANATVPAYQLMLRMPQFCDSVTNAKDNTGFSNYNALDVKYQHRLSNDLTILATYTHAKMLDDIEGGSTFELFYPEVVRNNYDLAAEKSVDYADTPNSAVVSYIYSLPVGRGKTFGSKLSGPGDAVLGGWQIAGITKFQAGTPIGINGNLDAASVYGGGQHSNVVGNPNVAGTVTANSTCNAPSKLGTAQAWFNPCAFVAAAPGTFGDAPRYFSNLRTPHYNDTDLSLSKWFNIGDNIRSQFRAEFFNTFNHVNFGPPTNVTVGTANAGSLSYADIARQIQFALKIYW